MQDSDALMETIDEEDNKMAEEQISVTQVGCTVAKAYCHKQVMMMDDRAKTQQWGLQIFGKAFIELLKLLKTGLTSPAATKKFCDAVGRICKS